MIIDLSEFEQKIDPKILKQGLTYFKDNRVVDFFENGPDEFEAYVEGTKQYQVTMRIRNRIMSENACTCTYMDGPICKHGAAMLFYILQDELGIKPKKQSAKKLNEQKPKRQLTDELLEKIRPDELLEFISQQLESDKAFKSTFLNHFARYHNQESIKSYCDQLKPVLQLARGANGVVLKSKAPQAADAMEKMLEKSVFSVETGNFLTAFYINAALMDELHRFFKNTRDNEAYLSPYVVKAFNNIKELSALNLPDKVRKLVFKYVLDKYLKQHYYLWSFEKYILEIISNLAVEENEIDRVNALFETVKHYDKLFGMKKILQYHFVKKHFGDLSAENCLSENIKDPEIRDFAIGLKIEQGDLQKARDLIQQAKSADSSKSYPLYLAQRELEIAKLEGDGQTVFNIKYSLIMDCADMDVVELYHELQEMVPGQSLKKLRADLFKAWSSEKIQRSDLLRRILIDEENWIELLESIRKDAALYELEQYEQFLLPDYSKELAQIYLDLMEEELTLNPYAVDYEQIIRYLRQVQKLGEREMVAQFIDQIKSRFKNRLTLIYHLNRV